MLSAQNAWCLWEDAHTRTVSLEVPVPSAGAGHALQGALLANFPWDGNEDGQATYAACPDDAAFRHLALTYAQAHKKMNRSKEFPGGITNGAAWYPVWGGMQVPMHPCHEVLCIRKLRLPTQPFCRPAQLVALQASGRLHHALTPACCRCRTGHMWWGSVLN